MVLFIHLSSLGQLFQDELFLFKRKSVLKCQGERFAFKHSFFSGICLKLLVDFGVGVGYESQRDLPEAVSTSFG